MNLTDDRQQNLQMQLDFSSTLTGEAREAWREEAELSEAADGCELQPVAGGDAVLGRKGPGRG